MSKPSTIRLTPTSISSPKILKNPNFIGFRYISIVGLNLEGNLDLNLLKGKIKEPVVTVLNGFCRHKGLQMDGFWRRNSLLVLGIANTFIGLFESMAKYGFLALSSASIAFSGLHLLSTFTINPDKVYRMAMRKLNASVNNLELMGAPPTGTDLRAYVMSRGSITLKNFKTRHRIKRCFLIFAALCAEMKTLVSVEVENENGQYDVKMLSEDTPMATGVTGPDQRLLLIGDEEEYRIGGGLISELRDPVVKAMAAAKEYEAHDIEEDKEDAERELEDAERTQRQEIGKI